MRNSKRQWRVRIDAVNRYMVNLNLTDDKLFERLFLTADR